MGSYSKKEKLIGERGLPAKLNYKRESPHQQKDRSSLTSSHSIHNYLCSHQRGACWVAEKREGHFAKSSLPWHHPGKPRFLVSWPCYTCTVFQTSQTYYNHLYIIYVAKKYYEKGVKFRRIYADICIWIWGSSFVLCVCIYGRKNNMVNTNFAG